ncbi:sugar transporter SWEET1 isoform X2 [Serinus canaria]|uniref:sugar transporter SWEET1 isoform X2 n=1 Tax=Serinus canaria TaxID=9135 RepID=UPI0011AE982F|nr:sugar transporter SWEET1 isoform X2 [Serinus canaria]
MGRAPGTVWGCSGPWMAGAEGLGVVLSSGGAGEGGGGDAVPAGCPLERLEPSHPSTAGHPGGCCPPPSPGLTCARCWRPRVWRTSSSCPSSPLMPSTAGSGPGEGGHRDLRGRGDPPGCSQVPVPYPCSNLSWLGYGCLKGDGTVITVNAIGAALQTLYILVYLYYSPAKVLLLLAVVVTGCGYFTILVDTGTRLTHLGLFCSIFTISMYLSPLADLAKVVRCKSTRCLSFPLTVTTLVASSSWTLYGLQLHDPYITVRWGGGMLRGAHPISSCPNPSYSIASHAVPSPFCSVPLLPHLTPLHPH